MRNSILPSKSIDELVEQQKLVLDDDTLSKTRNIVSEIAQRGKEAAVEYCKQFDGFTEESRLLSSRKDLESALEDIADSDKALLERVESRIRTFATAQLEALSNIKVPIPGGIAGHTLAPVEIAGCYAPGGRYPLPSSVLMTVITAKVAGVKQIVVASPHPNTLTLAAAAIAGADLVVHMGGAHAIAVLAHGAGICPPCDMIVGPGNRWVTAAKHIVSQHTGIDMIAGPSELVIVCDQHSNPEIIAADLIAQAEHDEDALPVLISLDSTIIDNIRNAIETQLKSLDTAKTARIALTRGGVICVSNIKEAGKMSDCLAPEHLQLSLKNPAHAVPYFAHYGAVFVGENSAEVLCDYGAGPNHVLPTSGAARHTGGLSVFTFCRIRTWLLIDEPKAAVSLAKDAEDLANIEGLFGHARACRMRIK